jgi:phage shock protein C
MEKKLYKDAKNKKLCGVCSGIAKYFDIDATLVRLGLIALCIFAGGGILAYIIAALVIPDDPADVIEG